MQRAAFVILALLGLVLMPSSGFASTYSSAVLADNPTGYWRLGETSPTQGSTADNQGSLGAAVDGTYQDDPTSVPGLLTGDSNTAILFDGSDDVDSDGLPDVVDIPDNDSLNGTVVDEYSIELIFSAADVSPNYSRAQF